MLFGVTDLIMVDVRTRVAAMQHKRGTSSEYKRQEVYALVAKDYPHVSRRMIAMAIELACRDLP